MKLIVTLKVQWWKIRPCLIIINTLYYLGLIDYGKAIDMAGNAARNSVKVGAVTIE